MTRTPSRKLRTYVALAAAAGFAALALGRPELVALGAPFASFVAVGLVLIEEPRLRLRVEPDRTRLLENETVEIVIELAAETPLHRVEVTLIPGPHFARHGPARFSVSPPSCDSPTVDRLTLRASRWGASRIGVLTLRAVDRFGLFDYTRTVDLGAVRVFPQVETIQALIAPLELQATTGSSVSRERGDGIEFVDVRPFVPGDRVRRINWRVTARRGALHVSEQHPERNANVILFLDTFSDVHDADGGTLELGVRAAASLAAGYLARRDRVGVVGFGGSMTGLAPGFGVPQMYRLLDVLIGSQAVFSYVGRDISFVPPRLLPPKALVIGVTPLADERFINALLDLRARRFDLAVLDVSPTRFTHPGATRTDALAYRLWLMHRAAIRSRFEQLGVPISEWTGTDPVQVPIAAAGGFRRRASWGTAA